MHSKYDVIRKELGTAKINLESNTVKAVLLDKTHYIANLVSDKTLSQIDTQAILGTAVTLTGKQVDDAGVFKANNPVFPLMAGELVGAIVLYKDTGNTTTSTLITYEDTPEFTTNGLDVTVEWNSLGIFRI